MLSPSAKEIAAEINTRVRLSSCLDEQVSILADAIQAVYDNARAVERYECAHEVERIAWSAPTASGEWALREVAKVAAAQIRARKD